jgi:hypothetical protein
VDDNHDYPLLTVDEIIQLLARFTPEQRSLAWSPQPPFESMGASDCRSPTGPQQTLESLPKKQENKTRKGRSRIDQ